MIPKAKIRGFEIVKNPDPTWVVRLPEQATTQAAGYDFHAVADVEIPPNFGAAPFLLPTGVKAYLKPGEMLLLANRSSNPKRGLLLANSVGIVDMDFFGNETDDGHIRFAYWNVHEEPVFIKRGDKIGQGIFLSFLKADGEGTDKTRTGGWGSTDATN